jgi:hypothetical protein
MISLSSLILSFVLFIVAKLTNEFTSLEEPADDSDFAVVAVFPADGSDSLDLKGELNPRHRREGLNFQS